MHHSIPDQQFTGQRSTANERNSAHKALARIQRLKGQTKACSGLLIAIHAEKERARAMTFLNTLSKSSQVIAGPYFVSHFGKAYVAFTLRETGSSGIKVDKDAA